MKSLPPKAEFHKWQFAIAISVLGVMIWAIFGSALLAISVSVIAIAIPTEVIRYRRSKIIKDEREGWPMVIDHLLSGVNSGVSLQQTLSDLSIRGPEQFKTHFQDISSEMSSGASFAEVMKRARGNFTHREPIKCWELLHWRE